jgi:hypothetical protein
MRSIAQLRPGVKRPALWRSPRYTHGSVAGGHFRCHKPARLRITQYASRITPGTHLALFANAGQRRWPRRRLSEPWCGFPPGTVGRGVGPPGSQAAASGTRRPGTRSSTIAPWCPPVYPGDSLYRHQEVWYTFEEAQWVWGASRRGQQSARATPGPPGSAASCDLAAHEPCPASGDRLSGLSICA